ncbi:Appr-1-p processing protein [bacterium (candidate division B38) B3_B38]|nr:MAG: Appr-1-p processing protein [bacterium (candidate division B38) B3_B38]
MEKKIGEVTIELYQGDITELEVDAIVNAANNHLWMGAGVAGAIKRKGGKIIEDEAVAQGPIPIGEAVLTTAGKLPAKYVIHAAGMGRDLRTDAHKVQESTKNSLLRAEEKKLSSIAFPAIGTGVGGLSYHECARAMLEAVVNHISKRTSLNRVIFALFGSDAFQAFQKELERY